MDVKFNVFKITFNIFKLFKERSFNDGASGNKDIFRSSEQEKLL